MKLKPIVASMALLASGSAFAGGYVEAPMEPVVDDSSRLEAELNRNQNQYFAQPDWFKRIRVSGLLQMNALVTERMPSGTLKDGAGGLRFGVDDTSSDLWLSRANVYFDADVNDYVSTHVALRFEGRDIFDAEDVLGGSSWSNFNDPFTFRKFDILDEANITFKNFVEWPVYLRAGVEYMRFGVYDRNQLPATVTQLLTQTQEAAVELGFVDMYGFNGAIYAFRGVPRVNEDARNINNGGVQIGYTWDNDDYGVDVSADWLYNMSDVNLIAFATGSNYEHTVGGVSLSAKGYYGDFDGTLQAAFALEDFDQAELAFDGFGAKPVAVYANVGYSFPMMGYDYRFGFGYSATWESVNIGLPEHRVQGDLTVGILKNVDMGFHVIWEDDYSESEGGTGDSAIYGLVSLTAKFA